MTGALGKRGATSCFGCDSPLPDEVGRYYCDPCVAQQTKEQGDEREAFDAFHKYADNVKTHRHLEKGAQ